MCTKKLSCTLNLHTCTHTHTYSFSNPEHHNQTSSEVSKFLLKAPNNPTLSVPRSPVPRTRTKEKLPHSHWKQSHSPASLVPPRTRGTAFCAAIIKKNGAKQKKKKKKKERKKELKEGRKMRLPWASRAPCTGMKRDRGGIAIRQPPWNDSTLQEGGIVAK